MTRVWRLVLAAVLTTLAFLTVPASPAAAAGCSTRNSDGATGGYSVLLYCSGAGFITGYGSTLTTANQEALLLYQLYTVSGVDCDGRSADTTTGGYSVLLYCSGAGFITGYGSSLSDAAFEARALATLYADQGRDCDGRSVSRSSGGYDVLLYCSGLGFVHGVGSTVTGAAANARLAATLG
ncbi:hypothetical protein [Mangrovihabitans endophyticus]|uniref:Secreted protein n=1 Tax=Mangrovihabitans endophyticus TaxID=1751298 RepID=A0A8J3BU79_9ACTN|nr:hypothetical protein [Mangrovihabitans endophyticus]GGK77762.1 hypothetical protein GCM10012284_09620 [Mangrovihabitans endophyticus]